MNHALARPTRSLSDDLIRQAEEWAQVEEATLSEETSWTVADLKRVARIATSRCRLDRSSLNDDPYRLAELGVGYAIAVDPHVSEIDAIYAGQEEIFSASRVVRKNHGISLTGNREPAARFWIYWNDTPTMPPKPTHIEERMALAEVLGGLPSKHLETLMLLAFTDSTQEAAEAAGITVFGFLHRAQRARSAALDLWFDHEAPPPLRRLPTQRRQVDRACPRGHVIGGDNVRWETRQGRRYARCRTCRRDAYQASRAKPVEKL